MWRGTLYILQAIAFAGVATVLMKESSTAYKTGRKHLFPSQSQSLIPAPSRITRLCA